MREREYAICTQREIEGDRKCNIHTEGDREKERERERERGNDGTRIRTQGQVVSRIISY